MGLDKDVEEMTDPTPEYFYDEMTQEEFEHLKKKVKMDPEFKINFIKWLDENYELPDP